jgi:FkbM family methyltransferase
MKSFLYILLNEVKRFFQIKEYRTLLLLGLKYGRTKRYTQRKVKFDGNEFVVADFQSFFWQYKQIYVDKCYQFSTSSKEPVIIDCGANVGLSAFFFAQSFPKAKVLAFEADANIHQCLSNNVKQFPSVESIHQAIWINNDGVQFSAEGADGGAVATGTSAKTINVPSVSLTDVLAKYSSIAMLKMDIEGAEVEVIRSAKNDLHKCENIFIEYHSFNGQPQHLHELLSILANNNFRYYVKEEVVLSQPFVTKGNKGNMDMQINIFAYKV